MTDPMHERHRKGRGIRRVFAALSIGLIVTLVSTFIRPRVASAHYPEILSCEQACEVVATGWPLVFVHDYLGMSVGNRADILDVWLGGDRFYKLPFAFDVLFWAVLAWCLFAMLRWIWRRSHC